MIYVDEMIVCLRNKHWPYNKACHLIADSDEELHAFAGQLGLRRSWFQNKSDLPHYDLTTGMRFNAVRLGAVEIDRNKFVEIMRKCRLKKRKGIQMLVLSPKFNEEIIFQNNDLEIKLKFYLDKNESLHVAITAPRSVDVSRKKIKCPVKSKTIYGHHLQCKNQVC